MAVQFILGRSGSGKTSRCIRSIADALAQSADGGPLILLVPEQATYQAERSILADDRIAGFSRLRILSFNRLQFHLSDGQDAESDISRIGLEMIVHKILRDNAPKLKAFGESASKAGLARELARTLTEFHEYEKQPQDVTNLADSIRTQSPGDPVADKLSDIAVVYQEYLDFIAAKSDIFVNPDSRPTDVRHKIEQSGFVRGARLWVDGFSSFTIQQRELLVELLKVSKDAHIALCLDPAGFDIKKPSHDDIDDADLFNQTRRTYADLFEIVKKCKLTLNEPVVLDRSLRFSNSAPLEHIERNLFTPHKSTGVKAGSDVRIVSAANSRAEVGFVARQILHLVRDENYRWRDIAVIASDLTGYQHYVEAMFDKTEYDIPFFIDRPKPLATHPVIELISSGLAAAVGGFATSDVLAFLKTGFGPVAPEEVAALENYCLAFGVGAGDWLSENDWVFAEKNDKTFDERAVNDIRCRAIGPLINLKDELAGSETNGLVKAEQFVGAVWRMLEQLKVGGKLSEWSGNETEEAVDHRQFFDKLVGVFDELGEIFAGDSMPASDLAAIAGEAFSALTLKLIPSSLDQVLVGSIERSRHPDLKAVFLLGTTQKQFPIPVTTDAILTEQDRQLAESQDFELADRLSQRLATRQYLAYIAFTRPSQRLYITYPTMDNDGKGLVRSGFIDNLVSLFSDLQTESFFDDSADINDACSASELKRLLCSRLGSDSQSDDDSELLGVYCSMRDDPDTLLAEVGQCVKFALEYDNRATLDAAVAEKLIGESMECSVTRLGGFAACPYQHFAKYMLNVGARKLFRFEPVDLGTFYHRVLDELFGALKEAGKDLATVDDDQLLVLCKEQIERIFRNDAFLANFMRRSAHNAYILDSAAQTIQECVVAIAEMSRAGEYRQKASELRFPPRDANGGRYQFTLPHGQTVTLRGSIDRVDVADVDGKKIAIVFDYKRRGRSVSWARLYHGLDMQLVVYMLALADARIEGKPIDAVAGAFFVPVEAPPVTAAISGIDAQFAKYEYKARGIIDGRFAHLLNREEKTGWDRYYNFAFDKSGQPYSYFATSGALKGEQFDAVIDAAKSRITAFAQRIFGGEIEIKPYRLAKQSPCGNCDYAALCRFDWQINDYNVLESLSKQQVVEKTGAHDV